MQLALSENWINIERGWNILGNAVPLRQGTLQLSKGICSSVLLF
jgi:hypothetical protein